MFTGVRIKDASHEAGWDWVNKRKIIFHDQEPILYDKFPKEWDTKIQWFNKLQTNNILSNSELNSVDKNIILDKAGWKDFYWFSNGFLSYEWYRFYRYAEYLEKSWHPSKIFSSYNRIMPDREHRLIIAGHLAKNYYNKSILSCHDYKNVSNKQKFSSTHLEKINFINKDLILEDLTPLTSNLSYTIRQNDFLDSFCHIVTERIFYEDKIHLTEKSFRPIVCCRPFLLVSSKHSLKYLQNYGFKTFNKFWSEDYDNISDHSQRLDSIIAIIDYLGSLSIQEIHNMLTDMQDILLYNRNHFYNTFPNLIHKEMLNNLNLALANESKQDCFYKKIIDSLNSVELEFIKTYPEISDYEDNNSSVVYYEYLNNHINKSNLNSVRPYIKDNAKHFVAILKGYNYINGNNF